MRACVCQVKSTFSLLRIFRLSSRAFFHLVLQRKRRQDSDREMLSERKTWWLWLQQKKKKKAGVEMKVQERMDGKTETEKGGGEHKSKSTRAQSWGKWTRQIRNKKILQAYKLVKSLTGDYQRKKKKRAAIPAEKWYSLDSVLVKFHYFFNKNSLLWKPMSFVHRRITF